jgi:multimeric flavodoxin WrbA
MKVLAFNGSPRMEEGTTELILSPFLDGMRSAGAEVELFYMARLDVGPCHGDLSCMFKTTGNRVQNDDANWLAVKARDADIIILATPVYVSGVTGGTKNLMDRLTALLVNPEFAVKDGRTYHPARVGEKCHKLVLVSTCAMWEIEKFDPLLVQMKAMDRDTAIIEFAGALLRPHSQFLMGMLRLGIPCGGIADAAREAGRQLIAEGEMSEATLGVVSRELVPHRLFAAITNAYTRRKLRSARKLPVEV